jgi:hypothetical protein
MKIQSMIVAAVAAVMPFTSQAGHYGHASYRSSTPNMYIFGGVSASEFNFDREDYYYSFGDGSQSDVAIEDTSTGVRFGLGMPLSNEIAFEVGYVDLGDLSTSAFSDGSQSLNGGFAPGTVRMDGDLSGGFIGMRLNSPLSEPVGAFARFGLYAWEFDGTLEDSAQRGRFVVEGADPYVGLGVRMALAPNADVQLAYDYYLLEADDKSMDFSADAVSVDFVLRF